MIVALIGYVFLVDFPEDASKTKFFLNAEEVKIMVERIERDRGDAHLTPFNLKHYLSQGKDWMVWYVSVLQTFTSSLEASADPSCEGSSPPMLCSPA